MASTATKSDAHVKETIPEVLTDAGAGKRYLRGRFLGKVMSNVSIHVLFLLTTIRSNQFDDPINLN